ncbi:MAG: methyltransferase domain-containing protein [Myxococcales bacterium]|nr:methyltransferase domain-containing protein [Myxococcales bacterium]
MDTIPWEEQAEQLLRCREGDGYMGLRPPARVDDEVAALLDHFALPAGASILDLGCGPGMYSARMGARGYAVTGVDIARPVIEHARAVATAAGLPCRYLTRSFLEMEFDGEFDAAFLTNSTINHLSEDALDELLRRVRRALRPGGLFACDLVVLPRDFHEQPPSESRTIFTLPRSPWSDRPHRWLERKLSFPAEGQRVVHHVIVPERGAPREFWSRFVMLERPAFSRRLARAGLDVEAWLDQDLRSPALPERELVWALARAR